MSSRNEINLCRETATTPQIHVRKPDRMFLSGRQGITNIAAILIATRMKIDYAQWSICITNFGDSPEELNGTGDPGGTPAPVTLITTRMKVDCSQLNICITNPGHSPAELNGTGDPGGTPAPVTNY